MSTDYAQKEREFIDSLQADTGHDLAAWMDRIAAQSLPHRNDIIDWLRSEGFIFAKASWLERIYHNGGQPIYPTPAAGRDGTSPSPDSTSAKENEKPPAKNDDAADDNDDSATKSAGCLGQRPALRLVAANEPDEEDTGMGARDEVPNIESDIPGVGAPPSSSKSLDDALLAAKGLMPLARLIVGVVQSAQPDVTLNVNGAVIVAQNQNAPFATLVLQPKVLRLALNCSGLTTPTGFESLGSASGRLVAAKVHIPAAMTHICPLDDARQIDSDLTDLIIQAARRTGRSSE